MAKRNYAKRETKEYNFLTEVFQWMCVWIFTMPYAFLFYKVKIADFFKLSVYDFVGFSGTARIHGQKLPGVSRVNGIPKHRP